MRKGSRRRLLGDLVLFFAVAACLAGAYGYVSSRRPKGLLGELDCYYATFDLRHGGYRVAPELARDGRESFDELTARRQPQAAITGTYYGPDRVPLGDMVADGRLIHRGYQRQGIGFTRDGRIRFLERHGSSRIDWRGCYAGISCGPRLLRSGAIDINVRRDGFTASAADLEAMRCAVGATSDGKLVMLAIRQPTTLKTLAMAMRELGAVDAINLDGGAVCAFYCDGKVLAHPVREMSNVLAVYRKQ